MLHIPQLIEHKRDGGSLTPEQIQSIIKGFTHGDIPDYQMSALAMAIFFRGMDPAETAALTAAMRDSGRVFRWPKDSPPKVDKHSTGGIGDKVSLVLAPLLACDGLWVPMISGRGLGITGGTLDKLESIPGFRVGLSEEECLRQIERIGVFMAGQTSDLCPADKKLYALRDVTGTVASKPLIIASIMSKKLAESLDRLILDVKYGSGAFMPTREDAEELARGLAAAGENNNVTTRYLLTPMEEPLGRAVGNALEVAEAIDTLHGHGPADLTELTLDLAAQVSNSPRERLAKWLTDGTAWRKFVEMTEAQDGDAAALEKILTTHQAPVIRPLVWEGTSSRVRIQAGSIGRATVQLGGGRRQSSDDIDFAVGFSDIRKSHEPCSPGDILCRVHARTEADAEAALTEVRAHLAPA